MYSEQEIEAQPLIDSDQWGRLESELGLDMLRDFSQEFFDETREVWLTPDFDPLAMEEKAFKSLAHRSAGAAGTIGFQRLRFVFLGMEHSPLGEDTLRFLSAMKVTFNVTKQWVNDKQ